MSPSASSPMRSLLSPEEPRRELPDDPLVPPRVAELPIPSSSMLPRSLRLDPENPPEPLLLDAPLCDEPDEPLPDEPLKPPCELWSFSRSAMVCASMLRKDDSGVRACPAFVSLQCPPLGETRIRKANAICRPRPPLTVSSARPTFRSPS